MYQNFKTLVWYFTYITRQYCIATVKFSQADVIEATRRRIEGGYALIKRVLLFRAIVADVIVCILPY